MNRSLALAAAVLSVTFLKPAWASFDPDGVTIDLKDAPIRNVLEQIFHTKNVQYTIDPRVQGTITAKFRDAPLLECVRSILKVAQVPARLEVADNVYRVLLVSPQKSQMTPRNISVDVTDAAISILLEGLFHQFDVPFRIEGELTGLVTLKANDQPLERVLTLLARSATQEVTWRVENGVYIVTAKGARQPVGDTALREDSIVLKAEVVTLSDDGRRTLLVSDLIVGQPGDLLESKEEARGVASRSARLSIRVRTERSGSGEFKASAFWDVALPLTGERGGIVSFQKTLNATLRLKPDVPTLAGGTAKNQYGLKERILFYLTWQTKPIDGPGASRVSL